jgi:hypothetical protein
MHRHRYGPPPVLDPDFDDLATGSVRDAKAPQVQPAIMHHTDAFFSFVIQKRGPIAMGKSNGGPFKSEKVPMSPAEQANRIRRLARQMQHGVMQKDLLSQGFTLADIKQAAQMIGKK